ncbi:MAG: hypothetical protein M3R24_38575 [Chloroflexota bacterium]|nr:hypothetical protein [Chloroflexota bacterium]PLS77198.1 MAG: hypothetical protein CYG59_25105 [Chloroflexota bacterium]
MARLWEVDWTTLLIAAAIIVSVLLTPYELLQLVQRRWERQQRARIARGEDVLPRPVPDDEDEQD